MREPNGELPKAVTDAFATFFKLGPETQDRALPLIQEAAIERGRNFPEGHFTTQAEREAADNRWKDYLRSLADKLASSMDEFYWAGHGGNLDGVVILKNTFLHIFDNQNAETLLQTKKQLEKVLGK